MSKLKGGSIGGGGYPEERGFILQVQLGTWLGTRWGNVNEGRGGVVRGYLLPAYTYVHLYSPALERYHRWISWAVMIFSDIFIGGLPTQICKIFFIHPVHPQSRTFPSGCSEHFVDYFASGFNLLVGKKEQLASCVGHTLGSEDEGTCHSCTIMSSEAVASWRQRESVNLWQPKPFNCKSTTKELGPIDRWWCWTDK